MFGELTFTLTHFLNKTIFPEGIGVYKMVVEISEGWGVILVVKKWKFRGEGGAYMKFPPWLRYGYFLELRIVTVGVIIVIVIVIVVVVIVHYYNCHRK